MSKPSPSHASKRFFLHIHRNLTIPPHLHTHTRPLTTNPPTTTPPPPQTHYSLFPQTLPHGPPPTGPFTLSPRALRTEYLTLQSAAHPDRHPGAEKATAETRSALINEAYRTLQSPLLRAQYLLSLRGEEVAEDEGARVEDAGLLAEVMEAREAIEGARGEGELEGVRRGNEARMGASEGVLAEAFGRDDVEGAKAEAVRLRYWTNIKEALDGWEKGKPVVLVH